MVEGVRLESVCGSNVTAGSNPVLSAIFYLGARIELEDIDYEKM